MKEPFFSFIPDLFTTLQQPALKNVIQFAPYISLKSFACESKDDVIENKKIFHCSPLNLFHSGMDSIDLYQ